MSRQDDRLGLLFAAYCVANTAVVPAVAKLTTAVASGLFIALSASFFAALCAVALLAWHGELSSGRGGGKCAYKKEDCRPVHYWTSSVKKIASP